MKKQEQIKNDIDSIDIMNIFKKGKLIIVLSIVVTMAAAFFATKLCTSPIYEAKAKILIKKEKLNPKEPFPSYETGWQYLGTQAEIMRSNPVINGALQKIDSSDKSFVLTDSKLLGSSIVKQSIEIKTLESSNILELSVRQEDPLLASMLANAIVETYIEHRVDMKSKTIERIISSLEKEIEAAKQDFVDVENELDEMTHKEGMIMLSGSDMILDIHKYADIDMHLMSVNAEIEMLNTKISEIKNRIEKTHTNDSDFKFIIASNILQNLQSQIRMAELKLDVLKGQFSVNHPDVIVTQASIDKLRIDLYKEREKILNAEIESWEIEKSSLMSKKDIMVQIQNRQKERVNKVLQNQPILARFDRDINMKRLIYTDLMQKLQESKVLRQRTNMLSDAEIIEFADVPDAPVKSNLLRNILLSGLVGLTIGFGMALAFSTLSVQEVEPENNFGQVTERRLSPRTKTSNKVTCTVVGEKKEYDCWGKNIGRSGMRIITNKKLQRNNILKFEIHRDKLKPIVGNGIVVWSSPVSVGGISEYAAGVKFYDLKLDVNNDIA